MNLSTSINRYRPAASLALAVLISGALMGCATTEERRRANLYEDADTCASFGARYGSPQHTQCMLLQQQRRDGEALAALERARLTSEIARNTQDMIDRREDRDD